MRIAGAEAAVSALAVEPAPVPARAVSGRAGPPILLDGANLPIVDLVRAAREGARVELSPAASARVAAAHARLHQLAASGRRIYGLNTGVGALETDDAGTSAAAALDRERQQALLRSHAAGIGPPMAEDAVRAMIIARASSLSRGVSGVSPAALAALLDLLAAGVTPLVPELGSVGASDLAPLAHVALVATGEGRARHRGVELPAGEALARAGLAPVALTGRDALALINGPAQSTALGALAAWDAARLIEAAELAAALTLVATGAPRDFLDPQLAAEKRHPGQAESARRARGLLAAPPGRRLQPVPAAVGSPPGEAGMPALLRAPLSSRYAPQVTGAARTALAHARAAIEAELGAGADNPLLCPDGEVTSNSATTGGQELALSLDLLAAALTSVAVASERRTAGLLEGRGGLPPFLRHPRARTGVDSGLMIAQYTAAAAVAELRARGGLASVQSIPTCAGVEDHVSMSALAARQAARAAELCQAVVAIELVCACQAAELSGRPLPPALGRALASVRARVPLWIHDRLLADDLAAAQELVRTGALVS